MTNKTIDYILDSIKKVASQAKAHLKEYKYLPDKNNFVNKKKPPVFPKLTLKA
jgi:hypothetical protein